jgi:hypothetical protein
MLIAASAASDPDREKKLFESGAGRIEASFSDRRISATL